MKKVTIYDIALKTGYSVGTVNRALSGKTRISPKTKQLILSTADELGYKVNAAAQALRRNPINLAAILFCPVEEYVDSIIDGILSAADDLDKYNVSIDIQKINYTTGKECITKTIEMINIFSDKKYDGIILFMSSMIDELQELSSLIKDLTEKNIYFATVANDIPDSNRVAYVGIDAFMAGSMAAELLEMQCAKKDVALLVTSTTSPINTEYIKGFLNYSQNNVFSNVKIYEHFDDKEKAIDVINLMLNENKNLKGVYMATASSGAACEHLEKLNKKDLTIITTDLLKETSGLLERKTASATIFQNPYRQGKMVVKLLYNFITKKECPEKYLLTPHIVDGAISDKFLLKKLKDIDSKTY